MSESVYIVRLSGDDAEEAREEIGGALEDLRDSGASFEFSIEPAPAGWAEVLS